MGVLRATALLAAICALRVAAASGAAEERWAALAAPVFHVVATTSSGLDGLPHTKTPISIAQDAAGFIWLGTAIGLERWDGYEFRTYDARPGDPCALQAENVEVLHVDDRRRLWVGTFDGGLARYEPGTDCFRTIPAGKDGLSGSYVKSIADDGAGGLWIGTTAGLDHLAADLAQVTHVDIAGHDRGATGTTAVQRILRDRDGAVWIGTEEGLQRRGSRDSDFSEFRLSAADGSHAPVRVLLQSADGRIWVGTGGGRAYVIDPANSSVRELAALGQLRDVGAVWDAAAAPDGEIWFATHGSGIVIVNPTTLSVRVVRHQKGVPTSLLQDSVEALFRDRGGLMWVLCWKGIGYYQVDSVTATILTVDAQNGLPEGTVSALARMNGDRIAVGSRREIALIGPESSAAESVPLENEPTLDGVFALATPNGRDLFAGIRPLGLVWIDRGTGHSTNVPLPGPGGPTQRIYSLTMEGDRLWVGGRNGVWTVVRNAASRRANAPWRVERHFELPSVFAIALGPGGIRWFGGTSGLHRLDGDSTTPLHMRLTGSSGAPIGDPFILALLVDRRNRLWVGTTTQGIYLVDPTTADGGHLRILKHLLSGETPNMGAAALIEDAHGAIWASSAVGVAGELARIDPDSLAVRLLGRGDGLVESEFWNGSAIATAHGELLFGGTNSVTVLRPERLGAPRKPPDIVITGISIGVRTVPPGLYDQEPSDRLLEVPAQAQSLSAGFAALDYADPGAHGYSYKLDGYDRDWVGAGSDNRIARYTNLAPGTYRLRLRATDRTGSVVGRERQLLVHVAAAWHQTMWFRALEALGAFLAFALILRSRTALLHARQRELESQVHERTQALIRATEERNSLIENLAHDLRTPLTSLRGYLERLTLRDENLSETDRGRFVDIAVRQAERLIRLVRELFELVRLDDPLARLALERFNPAEIVLDVVQEFDGIAAGRSIECELDRGVECAQIIGDISLFQRLIDNLVDNAVGHTPPGGTIKLRLAVDAASVVLEVSDTGRGIGKTDLGRIFDRYERGDTTGRVSGAGLGLAIVKRILELHRGSIVVESDVGVGSRFTVRLPVAGPAAPFGTEA